MEKVRNINDVVTPVTMESVEIELESVTGATVKFKLRYGLAAIREVLEKTGLSILQGQVTPEAIGEDLDRFMTVLKAGLRKHHPDVDSIDFDDLITANNIAYVSVMIIAACASVMPRIQGPQAQAEAEVPTDPPLPLGTN